MEQAPRRRAALTHPGAWRRDHSRSPAGRVRLSLCGAAAAPGRLAIIAPSQRRSHTPRAEERRSAGGTPRHQRQRRQRAPKARRWRQRNPETGHRAAEWRPDTPHRAPTHQEREQHNRQQHPRMAAPQGTRQQEGREPQEGEKRQRHRATRQPVCSGRNSHGGSWVGPHKMARGWKLGTERGRLEDRQQKAALRSILAIARA